MGFGDWIRKVFHKMFPKKTVEGKLNVQIATSAAMDRSVELWQQMYANHPPWQGEKVRSVVPLNLPATIAEEMARLTLTEFSLELTGSPRAEYILEQMENYLENLSGIVERWAALGGIALKPIVTGDDGAGNPAAIHIDINPANRFYPTAFNSNQEVTGAVFVDTKHIGDYIYTRLEHHNLNGTSYTVTNKAFRSERLNGSGTQDVLTCSYPFLQEVTLDSVEDWAGLEPEVTLEHIPSPLFVYVKIPRANNIDPESPLGASVFSRAVDTIRKADEQYSRTLWEYEATEAAVFAERSLFKQDKRGGTILPEGTERLFRVLDHETTPDKAPVLKEYAPTIRDVSMFNGLNELLRRIETQCGLAFGTLSNVADTEKTATEIKMSKQRSYTTIHAMQEAWERGLNRLIGVMDTLCSLYHLAPEGNIEVTCTWGDGVLEDTDLEYARRLSMVSANLMRPETFMAWYFGCTEEEALERYLPAPERNEEEDALDEEEE